MKILKLSLSNFLKGLKYVFTPIGVLSIFLIIGLSIAIPGITGALKTLFNGVQAVFQDTNVDWADAGSRFLAFIVGLDWSSPIETVTSLFSVEFLQNNILSILGDIFPELPSKIDAVNVLVQDCLTSIMTFIAILVALIAIGLIVGIIITSMQVKKEITHRKWWQSIVFGFIDAGFGVLSVWLVSKALQVENWWILFIVLILLGLIIYSFLIGWLIHGVKKVPFRKAINIKNVLFLLLGDVIIILLGVGVVLLVSLMNMIVLTAVVGLSAFVTTLSVLVANSESYIQYLSTTAYTKELEKKLKQKA